MSVMKPPPCLLSSSLSYFAWLVSESLSIRTKENTWLETLGCGVKTTIILQTLISLSYRSGRHAGFATIPTFLARFYRRCPTIQWNFDRWYLTQEEGWGEGKLIVSKTKRNLDQNFRKFRSKTQWIGSVQPEKVSSKLVQLLRWTTFPGRTRRNRF